MKKISTLLILAAACTSPTAWASTYKISVRLFFKPGEKLNSATVKGEDGVEGKLIFGEGASEVRLTPTPGEKPDTVKISAVVLRNGKVVARPTLVARLGNAAEISQNVSVDEVSGYRLQVTPESAD